MSRIIVCDTGPLLHLSESAVLDLLRGAGDVVVPPAVAAEFKRASSGKKLPDWILVKSVETRAKSRISEWLGRRMVDVGEAEAIGLAIQLKCNWLLTDDAAARQLAEDLGIEVHGSIGVLLWAVATRRVESREQAHRLLDGLTKTSLWISDRVVRSARQAIDDLLEH